MNEQRVVQECTLLLFSGLYQKAGVRNQTFRWEFSVKSCSQPVTAQVWLSPFAPNCYFPFVKFSNNTLTMLWVSDPGIKILWFARRGFVDAVWTILQKNGTKFTERKRTLGLSGDSASGVPGCLLLKSEPCFHACLSLCLGTLIVLWGVYIRTECLLSAFGPRFLQGSFRSSWLTTQPSHG